LLEPAASKMKLHPYGRNDLIGLFIAALSIQDVSAISKKDRIALRDQTKSVSHYRYLGLIPAAYPSGSPALESWLPKLYGVRLSRGKIKFLEVSLYF
jgi:hypothetical protein